MKYTRIIGTGSYFPEKVLTNFDLMKMVDTSNEWIVSRTGMHQRHIARKDESTSDMGYHAAKQAIEMAGIPLSEIDGVIFTTLTPDYTMPAAAALASAKLGLRGPFAFDLNIACSGFLYGLHVADGLIKTGKNRNILIISADKLSASLDYNDRATCILFGDGAGAALVTADSEPGIYASNMHADGYYGELLTFHGMGINYFANKDTMRLEDNMLKMNGNETFKLAVRNMCDVSMDTLQQSGLTEDQIDFLIPHQANIRIIEAVAKRFNIDRSKVIVNVDTKANVSSATIPTALDENVRNGKINKGDNLLMTAFGGGMGWGAVVVKF